MQAVKTIGLDIAKSIFQVHGVDADGQVVIRRKLKRRYVLAFFAKVPSCLIGMEACATSHHWSRELQTLGHRVAITVFAIWFAVVTLGLLHFRRCPALEFFYNQFTFGAARSVVKTFHRATKQQSPGQCGSCRSTF